MQGRSFEAAGPRPFGPIRILRHRGTNSTSEAPMDFTRGMKKALYFLAAFLTLGGFVVLDNLFRTDARDSHDSSGRA